jgi:hypothetical protein
MATYRFTIELPAFEVELSTESGATADQLLDAVTTEVDLTQGKLFKRLLKLGVSGEEIDEFEVGLSEGCVEVEVEEVES